MQNHLTVDLHGDRRSVTGTYRRGSELASFVAQTIPELHAKAHRALGDEVECLSVSTPWSIYCDVTGETARRVGSKGAWEPFMSESLGSP